MRQWLRRVVCATIGHCLGVFPDGYVYCPRCYALWPMGGR